MDALHTFYKPEGIAEIEQQINSFLANQQISIKEIDLIITGKNGDAGSDELYESLSKSVFVDKETINYKHLCGEYPTAAAFAMWLAATIVKSGNVPAAIEYKGLSERKIKKVLVYNHYQGIHHSLSLLSAC